MKILTLNLGSATFKFKVFSATAKNQLAEVFSLEIESKKNYQREITKVIKSIDGWRKIKFIGHRVVHGGKDFTDITLVTPTVVKKIKKYNELAPLHNPINMAGVAQSQKILPQAKQFLVFDTAYYKTMPDYAKLYALPEKFDKKYDIRRYGFHGISHKYAAQEGAKHICQPLKKLKIISCHIGSGASITATKYGQAIDTTMGFTPVEGLTMSTRVGDLDATVPLYMISELGYTINEVKDILNKQSGLLGLAGTKDMREILVGAGKKVVGWKPSRKLSKKQKQKCKLALDIFIYDIVRYIGQFYAVMGGLDLLVFTGGVGEKSPVVRQMILKQIKHLGKFRAVVVEADEERMIAREIIGKIKYKT